VQQLKLVKTWTAEWKKSCLFCCDTARFDEIFWNLFESIIRHVTVQTGLDINAKGDEEQKNVSCDITLGGAVRGKGNPLT